MHLLGWESTCKGPAQFKSVFNIFSILHLEFLEPFQRQVCMNGHNTAAMMYFPSPENEDQLFRAEESGSGCSQSPKRRYSELSFAFEIQHS